MIHLKFNNYFKSHTTFEKNKIYRDKSFPSSITPQSHRCIGTF